MNLTFLFPNEFLSDPSVPLGPPVKDLDRLLLQERAKAAAHINLLRVGTAAVSVAVLLLLPSTGSLTLDRIQVAALVALGRPHPEARPRWHSAIERDMFHA